MVNVEDLVAIVKSIWLAVAVLEKPRLLVGLSYERLSWISRFLELLRSKYCYSALTGS